MALARKAFTGLAYLFVLGVVVQVFLAGIGMFGDSDKDLGPHRDFGFTVMELIPLLMFGAALVGRMGIFLIGLTVFLFIIVALQSLWVSADSRFVEAVHPTMAIVLFALGHYLAQRSTRLGPAQA